MMNGFGGMRFRLIFRIITWWCYLGCNPDYLL